MDAQTFNRQHAVLEALLDHMSEKSGARPISRAEDAALEEAYDAERNAILGICVEPTDSLAEVQGRAAILADLMAAERWEDHHVALARRISDDLALIASANVTPLKRLSRAG